ncbi:MAG: S-layer homology domain-containing protein [Clostridia bacterium]|nr:S-layer homology domain-containing protein [Clostridia bacterium]
MTAKVVNAIGGDEVNPICIDNSATAVGGYEAAIMAVDNTNYTLTGGTGLTNEWTIEQSAADGSVKTYNGETETSAFTYGDTITVKAKFDATGTAASGFTLSSLALGTAAVFNGDTQISDAVTVTEGDEITLTVDSADLGAGDYTLTLKYCGDYNIAAMALDFDITIAKAEPTVTAPTGLTAVYGDTLKDVALPDADNGVWTWENAELSVGNVGDNKFTAIFTPTDSKYDTVTVEVTVTVEKAEPIYEVPTGLTAVYGDKLSDVALPNGWSWDDENMSVGEVGENEFAATYNPNDDNYNTVTANISVTVTKAEPAYEVPTGLTAVYGDSLASVTLPDGWTWEDESLNVGNAGTNAFTAIFTPGNDNYNTVTVEVSVTVEKAEPSYEVPTGLTAVYGDTLASVALPDNWTWADATASVGDAGGNTFAAIYTPEDVANYNTATEILTVTVEKAEQGVPSGFTVTQPDEETSTGTITGLTTDMEYSLDGGDTWEEITDDILTLDPGTVLIRYAETENYNAGAAVEITIDASNPSYTTPTDLTATYGDTLKDVELPTADNGIWTWENENQSVGNAGTNTFTVIFTPSDNNHNTVYVEVTVTVAKAMPTYEIPTGLTAVYGDILATVTLPTGWTWADAAQSAGNAGTNTFTAIFTPSDSVNYETVTAEIDVEVGKAAPVYELPTGLTATYGDTLASVELPDGWAWTDDTQSVGDVGTNTFTAIYTPDDTENYNTVTAEITVTISAITLTVTEAPTAARVKRNNTLSKSTLSGGSVALADGTEISGTWAWADGMETMSKSGTYERTAVFTADDESYGTVKATVTVTVYTSGGGGSSSGTVTYTVTAEDAENGGVNVSSTSAKSGASVTITVTPNDGYEAESITAADASGNEIELTQTDDDTYAFIMPSSDVSISAAFKKIATEENDSGEDEEDTHICQSEKFTDVNTSLWYHEYIDYVLENGLMNGTGGTTFEPDTATTRAMIVTILYRLEGEPKVNTAAAFTDVAAGDWYADAVAWAAENGIVLGYGDETFGANDVITREQTAAILYRYANYKSTDTSVGEDTNILSYTDADEISEYAIPAMQWAVGTGLVNGKGNNTLDPQGGATRAETAAMLMRFIEAE